MSAVALPVDWEGSDWGHVYLVDRNGKKLASILGKTENKIATVRAIIDALNGEASQPKGGE